MGLKKEKPLAAYLFLACASLFYLPLGFRALWDPDEGRYAEIAREMIELKDWITPHLNYVIYFEKPPLMYWLTAFSMQVLGNHAFAARFWCATFGLLTVVVTYQFGKWWKDEWTGLLAGGILATSLGFFALTQFLVLDMALTFWMMLALWAGSSLFVERSTSHARRMTYLLAFALSGGVLTKGLVALVLPLGTLGAVYFSQRRRLILPRIPWKAAMGLFGLITFPWFVLVTLQHPIYPYFFFIHEHLQRYFTNIHGRTQPVYFFLPVMALGFLPWSVFLPKVFQTWYSQRHVAFRRDPPGAVLIAWVFGVFVFFSLSHSKLVGYILPVFPALALLVANQFAESLEEESSLMPAWVGRGVAALTLFFMAGLLVLKLPPELLAIDNPQWKLMIEHSAVLALVLGAAVFVLVGVWGMRQTLACVGGVMIVQVLLLTSLSSLASVFDPFQSTRLLALRLQQERLGAQDKVVAYGLSYENKLQSLVFYGERRVAVFGPYGELSLGQSHDPAPDEWFVPEEKALPTMLSMPPGTWGVTDAEHWQALRQAADPDDFRAVSQSGNLLLFRKNN